MEEKFKCTKSIEDEYMISWGNKVISNHTNGKITYELETKTMHYIPRLIIRNRVEANADMAYVRDKGVSI